MAHTLRLCFFSRMPVLSFLEASCLEVSELEILCFTDPILPRSQV
jgi:hypothetical protein